MYQLIHRKRVQESFPNVEIALRMYLVLMISNCSTEHSFSKMKLIKNGLRTSMCNARLSHMVLMSIKLERDQLQGPGNRVCQEEVTRSFTTLKCLHVQNRLSILRLLVSCIGHLLQSATALVFHMLCGSVGFTSVALCPRL